MRNATSITLVLFILLAGCAPAPTPAPPTKPPVPATATATPLPPTVTLTPTETTVPSATPIVTGKWRITGVDVPELASFDTTLADYMRSHTISQGALAVTYKGRLILAHGYTYDADEHYATQPLTHFRIASLSKPFTAAAVLKLVQDGKLTLDTRIADVLDLTPAPGKSADPRLAQVTVAQVLYHRGGWDIAKLGFDPMFSDVRIRRAIGVPLPVSQADIIKYMSGVPLDHNPGSTYAYSNYGYMLLGRVIEAVSKQTYGDYVRDNVLKPMGITRMQLGRSLPRNRLPDEPAYHSDFTTNTVLDGTNAVVPWPDGGFNLENMDSHGGWVADVVDLARFEASFDHPDANPVLSADSIKTMFSAPPGGGGSRYYAMGWEVIRFGANSMTTFHTGSLDGTLSIMVRRRDGVDWIVVFNERDSTRDPKGDSYWEIDDLLHKAADAVKTWPDHDLFDQYP